MSEDLILIAKDDRCITADFLIAPCPVTVSEYLSVVEGRPGAPEEAEYVQQATWDQAIRYCNLLSLRLGLAPSYDEVLGLLIDERGRPAHHAAEAPGMRLPTPVEWEYAGRGLTPGSDTAAWERLHERFYWEYDANKWRRRGNLVANSLGLYGLLGNVQEWCSDTDLSRGVKGKRCAWTDYCYNYDRIAYRVDTSIQDAGTYCAFRVVRGPR